MQTCTGCGRAFEPYPVFGGVRLNLHGRKHCLGCRPHRNQRRPRRNVARPVRLKTCDSCGRSFPAKVVLDGRVRSMYRRRFCLVCSPFGAHNTSRTPPGSLDPGELAARRRMRRSDKTYRYQKKRRKSAKAKLVAERGGACVDCGYVGPAAALDFHHREPSGKDFAIGSFTGSWSRLVAESMKCDLVCASCHRLRHAAMRGLAKGGPVVEFRRSMKVRAVGFMGSSCRACDRVGPPAIFDFHHLDASRKSFGVGQDGVPRPWDKVVAELAKCVMLCANCHREVHAGVRTLAEGRLGLAEDAVAYAA